MNKVYHKYFYRSSAIKDEKMPNPMMLELVFGHCCSGKSSYANDMKQLYEKHDLGKLVVISSSDILKDYHKDVRKQDEKDIDEYGKIILNGILEKIEAIEDKNCHIIIEGIRQPSILHGILELGKKEEIFITKFLWFNTSYEVRAERFRNRNLEKDKGKSLQEIDKLDDMLGLNYIKDIIISISNYEKAKKEVNY